jgi:phospholipid/cholesterol/gamma-HCH transport system ATP-binding protein
MGISAAQNKNNMHDTDPYISIKNLSFRRADKVIFDRVNMRFEQGKITAIMGPTGTGKTTLLRLIGAQLYPQAGNILVKNTDIHTLSQNDLYDMRRSMGLLFQSAALFTNLTVFENVAFPMRVHTKLSEDLIHDIVLMKLQAVGLRGARHLYPSELSGGMGRRVALARAIVMDPELIMYDEPFAGQDPISMGVLLKLIKDLNELLNMTTIVVSHDVHETISIADYIYLIAEGRVVGEGTPQSLTESDNPHVRQFMHGLADGAVPFHYPARSYEEDLFA